MRNLRAAWRKPPCWGRVTAQRAEAQAKRSKTKSSHNRARLDWLPSSLPDWLNSEFYLETIQPKLASIPYRTLASTLNISLPYAGEIRSGRRLPHPRHWLTLAELAGVA